MKDKASSVLIIEPVKSVFVGADSESYSPHQILEEDQGILLIDAHAWLSQVAFAHHLDRVRHSTTIITIVESAASDLSAKRDSVVQHSFIGDAEIAEQVTIGAGSTITRDVPPSKLTLARTPQITIANWCAPRTNTEKA